MKKIGVILIFIGAAFSSCKKEKEQLPYAEQLKLDDQTIDQYLASNHITAIVDTTGMRYVIHKKGKGSIPKDTSTVSVELTARRLDNTAVYSDTSGAHYQINNLITGLQYGLIMMPRGSSYTFYFPSGLAYGTSGSSDGVVAANTNLIFDVKLLDDSAQLVTDVDSIDSYLKLSEDVIIKDPSGVRVIIVTPNPSAGEYANSTSTITVTYTANFLTYKGGAQFDSQTNVVFSPTDAIIKGFRIGVSYLKPGGEARIYIPSTLGYGFTGTDDGVIPRSANLVFDVKLIAIQ
jgi:FKBP-type peptidyl-prolyl cis-trans isomerase